MIVTRKAAESAGFEELLHHESVHVRQFRQYGVWGFLVRYIGAYVRARGRGYAHWAAYRRIPFEVEAVWETRLAGSHGWTDAGASGPSPTHPLVP